MHQLRSFKMSVPAFAVATVSAAMLAVGTQTAAAAPPAAPNPTGTTIVGMGSTLRRCDFSDQTHVSGTGTGQASANKPRSPRRR